MNTIGVVSLWLGSFSSPEEFNYLFEANYNENGEYIESEFEHLFNIGEYEYDLMEVGYLFDKKSEKIAEILFEFPYDSVIIPKFEKIINKDEIINLKANSVLLLYNYKFHENITQLQKSGNTLKYIGCVKYK